MKNSCQVVMMNLGLFVTCRLQLLKSSFCCQMLSETLVRARRRLCDQLEVSKEEFCEGVLQVRWCPGCLWTCLMCKNELVSGY